MSNIGLIGNTTFLATLFDFSVQMKNNQLSTADAIAPEVKTAAMAGHYMTYDQKAAFQALDTRREPGQAAKQISTQGTLVDFVLEPHALNKPIPRQLLEVTNEKEALANYQALVGELISVGTTSREKRIWDVINANVAADANYGAGWLTATGSAFTVNPFEQLVKACDEMELSTGIRPNRLIPGAAAWRAIKFSYPARGTFPQGLVPTSAVVEYLQGEGLAVYRANMGYANNMGQSARTITSIVGTNDVYLTYTSPTPLLSDPSGAKTLSFGAGIENLRTSWANNERDLMLCLDWNIKPVVTNAYAIKRITCTV